MEAWVLAMALNQEYPGVQAVALPLAWDHWGVHFCHCPALSNGDPMCSTKSPRYHGALEAKERTMQMSADIILVGFFAVLLTLTIVLAYGNPLFGQNWAQIREWFEVILPVETVLLGSAVGFYFGNRR
jgi:hypothetical protein